VLHNLLCHRDSTLVMVDHSGQKLLLKGSAAQAIKLIEAFGGGHYLT
jgi:hypothetical protein